MRNNATLDVLSYQPGVKGPQIRYAGVGNSASEVAGAGLAGMVWGGKLRSGVIRLRGALTVTPDFGLPASTFLGAVGITRDFLGFQTELPAYSASPANRLGFSRPKFD